MTLIRRTNPFGELISLRSAMDRLFEDSWVRPHNGTTDGHPLALDVRTTDDSYEIDVALPGVKPEDVDISLLGETLTITAKTAEEQSRDDEGYSYREIRRGSFSRTVTLPTAVKGDAANATFENGMLHLSVPKAEAAKPRQIQIKAAESKPQAPQPEVIEGQAASRQDSQNS
jgi:HSP20 family protein